MKTFQNLTHLLTFISGFSRSRRNVKKCRRNGIRRNANKSYFLPGVQLLICLTMLRGVGGTQIFILWVVCVFKKVPPIPVTWLILELPLCNHFVHDSGTS